MSSSTLMLERSLSPLWKVTHYSGLLFDWCRPIPRQGRLFVALRCFIIAMGLLLATYDMACYAVPFSKTLTSPNSTFLGTILEANNFMMQPIVLIVWVHFICNRNLMLSFFREWSISTVSNTNYVLNDHTLGAIIKKFTIGIYSMYGILYFPIMVLSLYHNMKESLIADGDIIISYYPAILENVFFISLKRIVLVSQDFVSCLFYLMLDIVPIQIYYHLTKEIEGIENGIKMMMEKLEDGNTNICELLEFLWSKYENLRSLLSRADNIFGPLIILSHGLAFFIICTSVYSLLIIVKNPADIPTEYPNIKWWISLTLVSQFVRLTVGVSLLSGVERSSKSLLSSVACLSLRRGHASEKEERRIIKAFLRRLETNTLAANPSGFYTITPSIGLTLLSLVVTYTIILLQTNSGGGFYETAGHI